MQLAFSHVAGPSRAASGGVATSFFFDAHDAERRIAAIERAGFSRLVVDDAGGLLTNMDIAAEAVRASGGIDIALTHWAGDIEPAVAARQLAALDAISGGRLALRMTAGGDIDATTHVEALARTDEYLVLLKRLWANTSPFDHEGPAYSLRAGFVPRKGPRGADIPVRMNGLSGTAFRVAGRHADVFELPYGAPDQLRHVIGRVLAAAAERGRSGKVGFALPLSLRHWQHGGTADDAMDAAIRAGSPERLAQALLPYASLGVSELMIHDLNTVETIAAFGDRIAPAIRDAAERRLSPEVAWPGRPFRPVLSAGLSAPDLLRHH
ncbi:LLM class flavin-dependent oxidoreductase [Kumtagia ephedrae]|uniref:LLM class flavin-dependent oxidoreductase n=1 Tax=Kumtagia ephedrae TaxID=2116701 RepID=A0A2P7SH04_9HYPH|nr:LLM class flavin-dependent oxidoreductase [Mesorhizobium ephedrae]PSJ61747.1 LLM class flavin-dependent oxidoreductase [Mesorhizobium ephedrae]